MYSSSNKNHHFESKWEPVMAPMFLLTVNYRRLRVSSDARAMVRPASCFLRGFFVFQQKRVVIYV